jgi:hypothetical protein
MTSSRPFSPGFVERLLGAALAVAALSPAVVSAGEIGLTGSLGLEARGFLATPAFEGQFDGFQLSLFASAELEGEDESGRNQFTLLPYLRLDQRDSERTHFDMREAYWRRVGSGWELLVGVDRVFWGVTESRHLVDIVNQDDAVEDVDGEDKLGQPMVAGSLVRDWGQLSLYLMPLFRERTFPGAEGRLRPRLPVDSDRAIYESDAGDGHLDLALRYSGYFGAWDLGLSLFDGTSRAPRLLPDAAGEALVPYYDQIRQLGVDVQHTRGPWLWKMEGLVRSGHGPSFGALVAGVEHTLYGIAGPADLGLLFEYLTDDRDPLLAPPTIFDDDVFVGARLALNDTQDTSALVGGILDLEDGSTALSVEAERRLGSRWKLELESRLFFDVSKKNPLVGFESDDFVTLRLSHFF